MINAVSNVNFGASTINLSDPGKFSKPVQPSHQGSKSHKGKAALSLAVLALGAYAGLGYAVKSGKLVKSTEIPEGFFNKSWTKIKDCAFSVGETAKTCIEKIQKLFGRKVENN